MNLFQSLKLFFCLFIILLCACNRKSPEKNLEIENIDSLPKPSITRISELPDSLLPDTVYIKDTIPPMVIPVPQSSGKIIQINSKYGDKKVVLSPPQKTEFRKNFAQGKGMFKTFTTDDGLPIDGISASITDDKGNLWFTTFGGGLSKFDGTTFVNFNSLHGVNNNNLMCLFKDSRGDIWIGTYGSGALRYDGVNFYDYSGLEIFQFNRNVMSINEDSKGNVWFGTYGAGVIRFDGKSFKRYSTKDGLAFDAVIDMIPDKNGNMWFGTYGGGISFFDGKSFTNYSRKEGLPFEVVWDFSRDNKNNLWIATNGGGLSYFNGKEFKNYSSKNELMGDKVHDLELDKAGKLWFTCDESYLTSYDGTTFLNYDKNFGLISSVLSISEDKDGNFWIGSLGSGITRFEGDAFVNFTKEHGLPHNQVLGINQDRSGKLWFGTYGGGVACYDGSSFTNYSMSQGLCNEIVVSIYEDSKNNIWFGTYGGGISCFDGKSFTNYSMSQGVQNINVESIIEDKNGNLWLGGVSGGLSCFNGSSFIYYNQKHGLAGNDIHCLYIDSKGNLWIGTESGMSSFDGNTFTTYNTSHGLPHNDVQSIKEDKAGNIWISTEKNGVSRFDRKSFLNFNTSHGIPDNCIYQVDFTKQNNLALATPGGLGLMTSFELIDPEKNKGQQSISLVNSLTNEELKNYTPFVETYHTKTGYPIKDLNCVFVDDKGIIWAGTGSDKTGLAKIDEVSIRRKKYIHKPQINKIKINNEYIPWYDLISVKRDTSFVDPSIKVFPANLIEEERLFQRKLSKNEKDTLHRKFGKIKFQDIDKEFSVPTHLVLPYENNNITFEFNAIELSRPDLLRYQYMLEGYDEGWNPVTEKTSASFGNIDEGKYTFKLRVSYTGPIDPSVKGWSKPIEYKFTVNPPVYRTFWAYAMYVIVFSGSIMGIYRWRTSALRRDKQVLEQTVKERTIEVVHQKEEAEKQKELADYRRTIVEEKQKEVLDSIHYAKRIQDALLKEDSHFGDKCPEHFILFKPKDIISGDFYWSLEKQGHWYVAAADCTGHGVPGAMMSMLGISFLNEINSTEILLSPAEILNELREKIVKELGSSGQTKDGMDISICCINLQSREFQWAGANNPLWIISKKVSVDPEMENNHENAYELIEVKGDKQPVGYSDIYHPFQNHTFNKKDVVYYLFTDGYADQFGGPKGKKFKYKPMQQMLLSHVHQSLEIQKQAYIDTFQQWRGEIEQVDDVCLIGIRLD